MTRFTSRLTFVLLFGGISMVVGGLAAMAIGAVTLVSAPDEVRLEVSSGPELVIPEESGFLGGSVMVYTASPAEDSPTFLGCELVEADGDVASATKLGGLDYALGEPVTVDGTTWHPFTEIDLMPRPATLRCPGDVLAPAAISQQSTFGGSTTLIGSFALGAGLFALVMGVLALLASRVVRRGSGAQG